MKAKEIVAHLKTQLEQGRSPFEKEVVVRLAGRDYAVRSIDASTAAVVLEGGDEILQDDMLPGTPARGPGDPEEEGGAPPPPAIGQSIMAAETVPQEERAGEG